MAAFTEEEELWSMSDEELEAAFKEAKAEEGSSETIIEQEQEEEIIPEPETGEEEEFEESEDLEQPANDEDSDDDDSSDEDVEESEEEDSEESDEDDLDGDSEEDEDEAADKDKAKSEDEQPVRKKYKANGKEYEFTEEEIFEKFGQVFGQAMNYTQKMQSIKPWRKTIDAIEQADLSAEDINLAIDVLKGDKDAIASLLKRTGVDALELDVDNAEYKPNDYGRNDTELAIKDIVDDIKGDAEYSKTYDVLEKQWDAKSREAFVQDPEKIRQLHIDVKSGMFDTIAPIANKLKVYDGGKQSDLDYYISAAQQYFDEQGKFEAQNTAVEEKTKRSDAISKVKAETSKRATTKASSAKRKAAAPTKKVAGATKRIDYLDDSDEAFDEWYKKIENAI